MSKETGGGSDLVLAAKALEEELGRLEELSRSAVKIRLHNDKSISRAARELNEALAQPERLANGLKSLAAAMARMQERQQAALEPLAARAVEIQQRATKLGECMQKLAALGAEATEATKLLQSTSAGALDGAVFAEVETRLGQITEGARALAEEARAEDLPDLARDVDALKQSIGALRGRLRPTN